MPFRALLYSFPFETDIQLEWIVSTNETSNSVAAGPINSKANIHCRDNGKYTSSQPPQPFTSSIARPHRQKQPHGMLLRLTNTMAFNTSRSHPAPQDLAYTSLAHHQTPPYTICLAPKYEEQKIRVFQKAYVSLLDFIRRPIPHGVAELLSRWTSYMPLKYFGVQLAISSIAYALRCRTPDIIMFLSFFQFSPYWCLWCLPFRRCGPSITANNFFAKK